MTSLRARLVVGLVALAAVGLTFAAAATYTSLRSFLYDRVDEQLIEARPVVVQALNQGAAFPRLRAQRDRSLPAGTYGVLLAPDGSEVAAGSLDRGLRQPPVIDQQDPVARAYTEAGWRVRLDRLVNTNGEIYTLGVAIPLDEVEATLARLVRVEVAVAVVVLSGLAALALWVVRVSLRPLERMGETAGAIAAGDLSRRVEPADDRTEVGRLGGSLNAMLHQIESAFDERTRSEDRLRRFVADAAHELRTPLTSIRGYAELFHRGAADRPDDLARSMQRIESEAERMGGLVDDLLLLARLDQGRPLESAPVDLASVATDVVADAGVAHPSRTVSLAVDRSGGSLVVVGDDHRLRQAVHNLVGNAIVHTPAGTPASVVVRREGAQVVVEVADEGPGIPEGELSHLFERFYRVDRSRARSSEGGTGLGLSIVAAVAEAHGGTTEAESTPGRGATFRLRLPAGDLT